MEDLPCTGICFETIGILSGGLEDSLNTGSGPLDASENTAPPFWSTGSDQAFLNFHKENFLNIPFKYVPNPLYLIFNNVDIFTYTDVPITILTRK